ncbi:MAG TPA: hypothetical protein VIV60_23205, partial [Polyangiaceae bacterium]
PRFASPFGPTATTPMRPPAANLEKLRDAPSENLEQTMQADIPEGVRSGQSAAAQVSPQTVAEQRVTGQPAMPESAEQRQMVPPGDSPLVTRGGTTPNEPEPVKPNTGRLEQISWPDDDSLPSVVGRPSASKPNGKKPHHLLRDAAEVAATNTDAVNSLIELRSAGQLPKAAAKATGRESVRPGTASTRPSAKASVRPQQPAKTSVPAESKADALEEGAAKHGGLQISMTTLILGFSTTVLAVVLIMILAQRSSRPAASIVPESHPTAQAAEPAAARPATQNQNQPVVDRTPQDRESSLSPKLVESKPATASDMKIERHKRTGKSGTNTAAKAASSDDDPSGDDSKATKRPRNYVPSDL